MTVRVRAAATKPAVPPVAGISKAGDTALQLTFTGILTTDVPNAKLLYGQAASAPATQADLIGPGFYPLTPEWWTSLASRYDAIGDVWTFTIASSSSYGDPAWTVGQNVWFGLVAPVGDPISSTPFLAVAGPFVILA